MTTGEITRNFPTDVSQSRRANFHFPEDGTEPVYKARSVSRISGLVLCSVEKRCRLTFPWSDGAQSQRKHSVASHLLQAWLLGENKQMLCDFLDGMEIKHQDDGTVEDLPPAPPKEKMAAAVSRLLDKYSAETVAVYLNVFRDMDSAVQWPALDEILREEPRLKL
jgi:hypothetical protein